MRRFKLTLAYDGTGLVGWQRQPTGPSVQALVEDALATLDGGPVAVAAAGRTDAGVHALGQVASFALARDIDAATLVRALNFHLPAAVRAVEAHQTDDSFHARFSARSKTYRYQIWNGPLMPPMLRAYSWHVPPPALDVGAMRQAARWLEGAHDFAAFQSVGTSVQDTTRTITSSTVESRGGDALGPATGLGPAAGSLICYEITGDGFLRHMVRAIAGTLVEIGRGQRDPASMADVLASADRARAGRTAPAEGLCLVRVTY